MTRRRTGVAALTVLFLGAGCGSSISYDRYAARANAICANTGQREQALGPAPRFAAATASNLAAATAYLGHLAPILSDSATQLRAIGPPDQKASAAMALAARIDAAANAFHDAAAAAATNDLPRFRAAFGSAVQADEEASRLDEKLGLPLCTQLATQAFRSAPSTVPSPVPGIVPSPTQP